MRRGELGESLNIEVELIEEGRPNRPGVSITPSKITIHNTSNSNAGADARAHSKWVRKTGYYMLNGAKNWVSWHFTVDDHRVIRHLPLGEKAWHAGGGNAASLGIEICMHEGIDQAAAFDRAARLVATLIWDLGLSVDDVVTHRKWTAKKCPTLLLDGGNEGGRWVRFKEQIAGYLAGMAAAAPGNLADAADTGEFQPVTCDERSCA